MCIEKIKTFKSILWILCIDRAWGKENTFYVLCVSPGLKVSILSINVCLLFMNSLTRDVTPRIKWGLKVHHDGFKLANLLEWQNAVASMR